MMPLAGTPAPNKRKKSTKIIMELNRDGGQEGSRLNLGKKISIPRDVMLEELSLLTNRGSKMFKLRKKRVEKFIYENNPDVFTDSSLDHFQKFIPTTGGQLGGGGRQGISYASGRMVGGVSAGQYGSDQQQQNLHGHSATLAGHGGSGGKSGEGEGVGTGSNSAPGTGDNAGGEGKHITIFKTYISPWERAMGVNAQQKVELGVDLLAYGAKADLPHYKSFNRTAMPYGGYEKASKRMTFQMPKLDIGPLLPEPLFLLNQSISNRPSFNRTPVPWLGSGEPNEYHIEVNIPLDGETEEL
ncbi:myozenin-1 [Tachyglossus aculeatus]|uniref:myozenin-1 n=1 Tax=Tachyglossus aculeatus TaxID=9261 RepID=UPI0018F34B4D|nr:myozenin-1 [Tachyglossus aculeatus]